ncbi:hypothetical protein LT493_13195 [Streptomyces tricolor]|nr:hypothetical protein [Streptomyces tricolor]
MTGPPASPERSVPVLALGDVLPVTVQGELLDGVAGRLRHDIARRPRGRPGAGGRRRARPLRRGDRRLLPRPRPGRGSPPVPACRPPGRSWPARVPPSPSPRSSWASPCPDRSRPWTSTGALSHLGRTAAAAPPPPAHPEEGA